VKLAKLDRRHNGYGLWTHRLEFTNGWSDRNNRLVRTDLIRNFYECRKWLSDQFGPGCFQFEGRLLVDQHVELPVWAYDEAGFVYVRGEAASMLALSIERFKRRYSENP
jgi:hypothetical protein